MSAALGLMLMQEEIAFLKAISSVELSPAVLRELRKAIATKKRTKAAACSKAKTSRVALIKRHATTSGAESEAHSSSRKASKPIAGKRKAEELLNPNGMTVPANRRPTPDTLVGSERLSTSSEPTAESSLQLYATEVRPAYATVVAPTLSSQVGSPSPKTMVRTLPNLLPLPRQPSGAYLLKTCPGLCAACQLAALRPRSSP